MTRLPWHYACFLALLAMIPALVQCVAGVTLTGTGAAADGPFTVGALSQFSAEFAAGNWQPRWAWMGNSGLGSPVFFFYPPGAYLLSMPLRLLFPQLATATVIGIMGVIYRALALCTCALWLRRRYGGSVALAGGALYCLMPYISFYNPQYRLAYAETSATFVLPLLFLSIDLGATHVYKTILFVSLAVFLLVLFHLPSTVTMCGLSVAYAGLLAGSRRAAVVQMGAVLAGFLLGLALAAFNTIPAIRLLPEISVTALQNFGWQGFFLLRYLSNPYYLTLNICLLIPLIAGLSAMRESWRHPRARAASGIFMLSVFLAVPLSWPVWKIIYPLQRVQFPWRFLLPISLMAAALLSHKLAGASPKWRAYALAAACIVAGITAAYSLQTSAHMSPAASERDRLALAAPYVDAPEYMPAIPAAKGWFYFHQNKGDSQARAALAVSSCLQLADNPPLRSGNTMQFNVTRCAGPTVLPQFYFPGWTASDARGDNMGLSPDPVSGMVSAEVKPGTAELFLRRNRLPEETWGCRIGLIACIIWIMLAVHAITRFRLI